MVLVLRGLHEFCRLLYFIKRCQLSRTDRWEAESRAFKRTLVLALALPGCQHLQLLGFGVIILVHGRIRVEIPLTYWYVLIARVCLHMDFWLHVSYQGLAFGHFRVTVRLTRGLPLSACGLNPQMLARFFDIYGDHNTRLLLAIVVDASIPDNN